MAAAASMSSSSMSSSSSSSMSSSSSSSMSSSSSSSMSSSSSSSMSSSSSSSMSSDDNELIRTITDLRLRIPNRRFDDRHTSALTGAPGSVIVRSGTGVGSSRAPTPTPSTPKTPKTPKTPSEAELRAARLNAALLAPSDDHIVVQLGHGSAVVSRKKSSKPTTPTPTDSSSAAAPARSPVQPLPTPDPYIPYQSAFVPVREEDQKDEYEV